MHYIYTMLQKVHVAKATTDPFAQVEIASDDGSKIKIATIDLDGTLLTSFSGYDEETFEYLLSVRLIFNVIKLPVPTTFKPSIWVLISFPSRRLISFNEE